MDLSQLHISPYCLLLRLIFLSNTTHWCSALMQMVNASTPSLYQRLCPAGYCRNGPCYVAGREPRCVCEELYYGERCQHVSLKRVTVIVLGNMVIFQWEWPPRLRGYSFVYYELGVKGAPVYRHQIHMGEMERSVLVGNFRGGLALYRVCLEDAAVAEEALASRAVLTNCMDVHTEWDYHSLIGWVFAGLGVVLIVCIIYMQRDKMEILYFHTPFYLYEKPQEEDEEDEDGEGEDGDEEDPDDGDEFDGSRSQLRWEQEIESSLSPSLHRASSHDMDVRDKHRTVSFKT